MRMLSVNDSNSGYIHSMQLSGNTFHDGSNMQLKGVASPLCYIRSITLNNRKCWQSTLLTVFTRKQTMSRIIAAVCIPSQDHSSHTGSKYAKVAEFKGPQQCNSH